MILYRLASKYSSLSKNIAINVMAFFIFSSISNLGMYGITEFTAIINPPQSGILAVGGIQTRPRPENEGEDLLKGAIKTIIATLSCDTRVIDNELASKWLTFFRETVESPMMLRLL